LDSSDSVWIFIPDSELNFSFLHTPNCSALVVTGEWCGGDVKVAEENNMDPELVKRVNAVVTQSPFVVQSSVLHAGDDAEDVSVC